VAFKNELIPDEQKDKFSFPVQVLYGGSKPTLYKWVIDADNDFYLVKAATEGNGYDGVKEQNTFYLHAFNENVYIKATPWDLPLTPEGEWVFRWEITQLKIPNSITSKRENVLLLVKESFFVWGCRNNGEVYDRVIVDFSFDL